MPTLAAKRDELDAKRKQLHEIFAKYPDVAEMSPDDAKEIKPRNDEITALAKEVEDLAALDKAKADNDAALKARTTPVNRPPFARDDDERQPTAKGFRQILDESVEYKVFREARRGTVVFELPELEAKTLLTLSTINNVATRRPGIVPPAEETRTVRDLILDGTTDNNTLTYMEETTTTNNASTVSEGGAKPESALGFTERTDNVRKIATWIPATTELLADVAGFESYVRERLAFFVRRTEESQLLLGDGVAPNILGLENRTGVQSQAKGGDTTPDAIYKGMVLAEVNAFAEPTSIVFHPTDWQDIRLLKDSAGNYIWGDPMDAGPERIWGLPIRKTTAQTLNTAFIISRPHAQVFQREGITITISTEHSDFFVHNKVAILAEERLALAVYRPAAFVKVTGI